jgi:hypothetical protein
VALKCIEPVGILPLAWVVEEDVRSLDEASRQHGRNPKHVEDLRNWQERAASAVQKNGGNTPPRRRFEVRTDTRSHAVQAFWAMHVEALNWSGMSVRDYATAPSFAVESAQVVRPARRPRGGDRMAGASFIRVPVHE